jgi:hypothetical protein
MNLSHRSIEWKAGDVNGCVGLGRCWFAGGLLSLVAIFGPFLTLFTVLSWVKEETDGQCLVLPRQYSCDGRG